MISYEQDLILLCTGLEPGTRVEASFAYVPDDGTKGENVGANAVTVRANGSARFVTDYEEVTTLDGVPYDRPGNIHAWVRAAGSGLDGPPLETADGEASLDIPVS